MPTVYTWTVVAGLSGGIGTAAGAGVGTGVDGRRPYAVARKMDPSEGDVVFNAPRRTWATGAPLAEKALRCLRTEEGTAQRDLAYGVDWSQLENARTNAAAIARLAITDAFKRYVDAGEMRDLKVEADVTKAASGAGLVLLISFADARGETFAIRGKGRRS